MAYFKCIGGSGNKNLMTVNVLEGTSVPTNDYGLDGQIYLKYGPETRYIYDETLGGYVLNEYYVSEADQSLCNISGRNFQKYADGGAIAVTWNNTSYSGPLLISTVEQNVYCTNNTSSSMGSATIDGVTWYITTTNYWSNPIRSNAVPILAKDYIPSANSRIQDAIEDRNGTTIWVIMESMKYSILSQRALRATVIPLL